MLGKYSLAEIYPQLLNQSLIVTQTGLALNLWPMQADLY